MQYMHIHCTIQDTKLKKKSKHRSENLTMMNYYDLINDVYSCRFPCDSVVDKSLVVQLTKCYNTEYAGSSC